MTPNYEYDVFISYAVQDKMFVTELVNHLEKAQVKVWYSGQELRVGSSIEEIIKQGLNKSRYGVTILSKNYFIKDWPQREFHALWGRSDSFIIPVWHNVDMEEVKSFDAFLADRWAIESHRGPDFVAQKIIETIRQKKSNIQLTTAAAGNKRNKLVARSGGFLVLLLVAIGAWYFMIRDLPSDNLIKTTIEDRINTFQKKIYKEHQLEMKELAGDTATINQISAYSDRYNDLKAHYRNEYYFTTGYHKFNFKKNVEPAIGKEIDSLNPVNLYGFEDPEIYLSDIKSSPYTMNVKYVFINTQPTSYEILDKDKVDDFTYTVEIRYQNNLRYLSVALIYEQSSKGMKYRQTTFRGFLPRETYQFKKQNENWVFVGLE